MTVTSHPWQQQQYNQRQTDREVQLWRAKHKDKDTL
jgi:hypothetical protein